MTACYFSALWEADPSSDLIRAAISNFNARKNASVLWIPQHNTFNQQGLQTIDWRHLSADPSNSKPPALEDITAFLSSYFPAWDATTQRNAGAFRPNELVIQIDNAFAQLDSGQHAPPPLSYYRYVLETRYWKKVTLINLGETRNPISDYLIDKYPKINVFNKSLTEAWQAIIESSNIVIGASLLPQALCSMAYGKKRVWVPGYAQRPDFESHDELEVNRIEVIDYIQDWQWRSSNQQRKFLLTFPPTGILDETRWVFTETERCRNFEFCQSCRDTGTAGKLWRQVIQQRFEVPKRDWECPHGWKWGGKPGPLLSLKKALRIGSAIKKTTTALGVKPCADCEERRMKLDGERR